MRILLALMRKEFYHITRDVSSILISVVIPLLLLFIFGYGINVDNNTVKLGLIVQDRTQTTESLIRAFTSSQFFEISMSTNVKELETALVRGKIRGMVIIPSNFTKNYNSTKKAQIQVITDGSEPNTASFIYAYTNGVVETWLQHEAEDSGTSKAASANIEIKSSFWYNPTLRSLDSIVPGAIAIVMTVIGTLLTALVVAREWERGTMEALMATPVSVRQIMLGKLIPYFILGIISMILCWIIAVFYYNVPFRGSFFALGIVTTIFLLCSLGLGLFISSATKDQFLASQLALMSGFLPAMMLSGFVFEISSMPLPIRALTYLFSGRYIVTSLRTLFLAGDVWILLLKSIACMLIIALVFFFLASRKTAKRLDL